MKQFIAIICLIGLCASTAMAAVAKPVCGGTTSSKDIQLIQPLNPPRECNYLVTDYSTLVCQLRLDFTFTLAQPTIPSSANNLKYVECQNDYLLVNGMKFCGVESNQHIYVPFNRTLGVKSVPIKVVLAARSGGSVLPTPSWDIKVTQLECPAGGSVRSIDLARGLDAVPEGRAVSNSDGFYVAPPGCLQYFPQASGTIQTFNYNGGKGVYPGNMNYAICFRRTSSTAGLQLTSSSFRLGAEFANTGTLQMDSYCYSQVGGGISEDYLFIPQGVVSVSNVRASYYCGESLKGKTVRTTSPGPISIVFNSDAAYRANDNGFSLTYKLF